MNFLADLPLCLHATEKAANCGEGLLLGCHVQEFAGFLAPEMKEDLVVDRSPQGELLRINFNISFPSLSCEFATLDVSDSLGTVRSALRRGFA